MADLPGKCNVNLDYFNNMSIFGRLQLCTEAYEHEPLIPRNLKRVGRDGCSQADPKKRFKPDTSDVHECREQIRIAN